MLMIMSQAGIFITLGGEDGPPLLRSLETVLADKVAAGGGAPGIRDMARIGWEESFHSAPEPDTGGARRFGEWDGMAPDERASLKYALTRRELDVLYLIVQGKSNKGIARDLCITIHTVKIHVGNILRKLGVDDRTQVAIKALKEELVTFGN